MLFDEIDPKHREAEAFIAAVEAEEDAQDREAYETRKTGPGVPWEDVQRELGLLWLRTARL